MKQGKKLDVKSLLGKISNKIEEEKQGRKPNKAKEVKDAANAILNDVEAITIAKEMKKSLRNTIKEAKRNTKEDERSNRREDVEEEEEAEAKEDDPSSNDDEETEGENVGEEKGEEGDDGIRETEQKKKKSKRIDDDEDDEEGFVSKDDEEGGENRGKNSRRPKRGVGQEPPRAPGRRTSGASERIHVQKLDNALYVHTDESLVRDQKAIDKIYAKIPISRKQTGREVLGYIDKLQYVVLARAERMLSDGRLLVSPSELIKLAAALKDMQLTIKWTKKLEDIITNNPSKMLPTGSGRGFTLLSKLREMSSTAKRESERDNRQSGARNTNRVFIPLPSDDEEKPKKAAEGA